MKKLTIILLACAAILTSCNNSDTDSAAEKNVKKYTAFNADSCYTYLTAQTDMGARVMNTPAHEECKEYIAATAERLGATVSLQAADLKAYEGSVLKSTNIIASLHPERVNRILVAAHYDSRPWCDEELLKEDSEQPVLGANDGASGVAVMLELIRTIEWDSIKAGVDFIFLDAEDYGVSEVENSFCLGSQYWAKNVKNSGKRYRFGILLDMVGAPDALFYRDQVSDYYAKDFVDLVWKEAERLGYGDMFVNSAGGGITDDHYYINKIAGIPCIDIIHFVPGQGFPATWHTQRDTPAHISAETLGKVGEVVGNVIYKF